MAGHRRPQNPIVFVEKKVPYKNFPHDEGEVVVGPGIHEIEIHTKAKQMLKAMRSSIEENAEGELEEVFDDVPMRVWVCFEDVAQIPVCMGSLDKASAVITEDGFILYLEVHSTERLVKWYAEM
jgi:hypothetical protein